MYNELRLLTFGQHGMIDDSVSSPPHGEQKKRYTVGYTKAERLLKILCTDSYRQSKEWYPRVVCSYKRTVILNTTALDATYCVYLQ